MGQSQNQQPARQGPPPGPEDYITGAIQDASGARLPLARRRYDLREQRVAGFTQHPELTQYINPNSEVVQHANWPGYRPWETDYLIDEIRHLDPRLKKQPSGYSPPFVGKPPGNYPTYYTDPLNPDPNRNQGQVHPGGVWNAPPAPDIHNVYPTPPVPAWWPEVLTPPGATREDEEKKTTPPYVPGQGGGGGGMTAQQQAALARILQGRGARR